MGIISLIYTGAVIAGACCGKESIQTQDDLRDFKYNTLVKQEEKKDGLDVYKTNKFLNGSRDVKCPLCKFPLSEEENKAIDNILKNGYFKFLHIVREYSDVDFINLTDDILEKLESIYAKLEEPKKYIEENRYFYHLCTRNAECQRMENQAIYIDLIDEIVGFDFDSLLPYDHKKLRSDPEYRKEISQRKTEAYNKRMNKIRIQEIENEYRAEFEDYCIEVEDSQIYRAKNDIKFGYDCRAKPGDICYKSPEELARSLWDCNERMVFYSASKNILLDYIIQLTGETPFKITGITRIGMSDREYYDFQEFIKKRDSEYAELLKNI